METLEQRIEALERLVADLNGQFDERIRKIVNEEINRSEQKMARAICHPRLLEVLAKKFPAQ